jgi:hypothetical protein
MTDEALEKAWTLMKQRYTGWDGNRTRERRGKCTKCNAKQTWDRCGKDSSSYAFECSNFDYTE